ncbi:hypothetical protein GCM10007170_03870 [Arthrobacter liuii]|uniref:Uncharacterized protein n=1 Tax=Arthrobacter liuii TaxID=1476996 RepID=A0ABQ2AGT2_9MICC|nr:hypothetical protein GCM10007170_03870 [Arthrobacter liuii]
MPAADAGEQRQPVPARRRAGHAPPQLVTRRLDFILQTPPRARLSRRGRTQYKIAPSTEFCRGLPLLRIYPVHAAGVPAIEAMAAAIRNWHTRVKKKQGLPKNGKPCLET